MPQKGQPELAATALPTRTKRSITLTAEAKPAKKSQPDVANPLSRPTTRLNVFVIGSGENCELGLGPNGKRPTSAPRPRLNHLLDSDSVGVVQVAAGGMHCVALTHDGKVLTWGINDDGALGRDTPAVDLSDGDGDDLLAWQLNPHESTPTAVVLDDGVEIVQVTATDSTCFALTSEGLVYGWGSFRAGDGKFGFLPDKEQGSKEPKPVLIPGLSNIKRLEGGSGHVLALTDDGCVFGWGTGEQNELGRRLLTRRHGRHDTLVPQKVGFPKNASIHEIFAGSHHSFAIDTKGRVWTFGLNNFGQCGISTREGTGFTTVISPTEVASLKGYTIRHIAGGAHHSLACTDEGQVLVWGRCDDGQMGLLLDTVPEEDVIFDSKGRPRVLNTPAVIPDLKAVFVAARIDNCFAISDEGKMFSWGFSEDYRTGLATNDTVKEPTLVRSKDLGDKKLVFVGCGGQFAIAAEATS